MASPVFIMSLMPGKSGIRLLLIRFSRPGDPISGLMPEKSLIRNKMPEPRRTKPQRRSPMPEITRIGQAFAARRVQLGLTQHLLADLAGVSRYSVQALEHGTGSVKLGSIIQIAEILGLRMEVAPVGAAR
jgi:DNA-binding XRE family transcriptional regulator